MFDFGDPRTVWLNVTNIVLGLVTLACLALVAKALFDELRVRRGSRVVSPDDHAYTVDGLGLTMADGGEKIGSEKK
ncbi:MAG: hypothetical protein EHM61_25390 [Acidobacteria bacterium]|nr:MAG: hypothetical protein EHM61_25390 [Acidobacteriota bacterium]